MNSQSPLTILISKDRGVSVSHSAVANVPSLLASHNPRFAHAVQQPDFFVVRIGGPHAIKNHEHVILSCVSYFTSEVLHLGRVVGARGVTARVVICARLIVGRLHMSGIPEVTRALEIFAAADSVPIARRVHALPPVVSSGPEVLGPEEFFPRLIHQHRVVSDSAPVVVQVVRTLSVSVVGATFGGEITFVVNQEMVLIKVVVLSEVWTRIELNPGRIGSEAVAHYEVSNSAKEVVAGNLCIVCVSRIARGTCRVVPQKLSDRNSTIFARGPTALSQQPCRKGIFETINGIAEADVVFPLEVRKFIVIIARGCAIGKHLIEISVGVMVKDGVAPRRIVVAHSAT